MVEKSVKKKINCKITDIVPYTQKNTGQLRARLGVLFWEDDPRDTWHQAIDMPAPDTPMSMEKFLKILASEEYVNIQRPKDTLQDLKDSVGKPFEVELPD